MGSLSLTLAHWVCRTHLVRLRVGCLAFCDEEGRYVSLDCISKDFKAGVEGGSIRGESGMDRDERGWRKGEKRRKVKGQAIGEG